MSICIHVLPMNRQYFYCIYIIILKSLQLCHLWHLWHVYPIILLYIYQFILVHLTSHMIYWISHLNFIEYYFKGLRKVAVSIWWIQPWYTFLSIPSISLTVHKFKCTSIYLNIPIHNNIWVGFTVAYSKKSIYFQVNPNKRKVWESLIKNEIFGAIFKITWNV